MFREVLEVLSERRGPGSLEGSEREINKRLPLTQNLKNPQNPSNLTPSQNLKNPQNPSNLATLDTRAVRGEQWAVCMEVA